MKKICSLFLLFLLATPSFALEKVAVWFSDEDFDVKKVNKNFQKMALEKTISEKKEKEKEKEIQKEEEKMEIIIDAFLKKQNSIEKLEKLKYRLDKIYYSDLYYKQKEKIRIFLDLLSDKVIEKIEDLKKQEKIKKAKKVEEKINLKNISKEEKEKFKKQMLKLQNIIKKETFNYIDNSAKNIEKYLYVKEKWNLKLNLKADIKDSWKFNFIMNLKDYISNTQFLDNSLKTDLDILFKWKNTKNQDMVLNISAYLEFIEKDWKRYLLIKNFSQDWKNVTKDITMSLAIFEGILNKWKFIKIPENYNDSMVNNFFKNLSKENLKQGVSKALEKPLFTAYKKVKNRYYLIPTQQTCDLFIKTISSVNPYIFYGKNSCDEDTYKELLINMEDNNFEIYLENGEIGFIAHEKNIEKAQGFFKIQKEELKQINLTIIPNQKIYPKEKFVFNYEKNKEITNYLNIDKGNVFNNTKIVLDSKNNIKSVNIVWKSVNYPEIKYNFNYKDKKIEWSFNVKDNKKDLFNLDFSWTIDTNHIKINSDFSYLDFLTKQRSEVRDMLRYADLKSLQSALEIYFMDSALYPTKKDLKNVINNYISKFPKDPLGNVEINWCKFGYKYEIWEDNMSYRLSACTENWKKIEIWNFNSNFKVKESFYINWYTTWVKREKEEIKKNIWKITLESDLTDNKDNLDFKLNIKQNWKEFLDINLTNTWTREYKKEEIQAPQDYIDYGKTLMQTY